MMMRNILIIFIIIIATFNERLLVGNGILITPLSTSSTLGEEQQQQNSAGHRSMRDIFIDIDNDGDLYSYILSQRIKVPPKKAEIQYYKHPVGYNNIHL